MVYQRIFQKSRSIAPRLSGSKGHWVISVSLLLLILRAFLPSAWAEDNIGKRAVVLDLRSGNQNDRIEAHRALIENLGQHGRLQLLGEPELVSILGRSLYSKTLEDGRRKLDAAAIAFGKLDCLATRKLTDDAILFLVAARAEGASTKSELHKAHLFQFLCADREGEIDQAMMAATSLRTLTQGERPKEISERTWRKYPELDALSNLRRVPVLLTSNIPGATIWVDHELVGKTPMTRFLREGMHFFAMGKDGISASSLESIPEQRKIELSLRKSPSQWRGLAQKVEDIRTSAEPDAKTSRRAAMGELMAVVEVDIVFAMLEKGGISVWTQAASQRTPTDLGQAENAREAGRLALREIRERSRPALDLSMPLLRENDVPQSDSAKPRRRWWLYGLVLGAAAAGAGVILLQDLRDDRQRIEVTLP